MWGTRVGAVHPLGRIFARSPAVQAESAFRYNSDFNLYFASHSAREGGTQSAALIAGAEQAF
jgi:hypothetical protein